MVYEVKHSDYSKHSHLFKSSGPEGALLENAFSHDFISQTLYVDDLNHSSIALLKLPIVFLLVGNPESPSLNSLLEIIPNKSGFTFPHTDNWLSQMKKYRPMLSVKWSSNYMSHQSLKIDHIQELSKTIPKDYNVKRVTENNINELPEEICSHIPRNFGSFENFLKYGIGFCIMEGDKPINLASSLLPYTNKLEVYIVTVKDEKYRKKGFATIACAKLLEFCLNEGIEPYWSAMNEASLKLATKLGYENPTLFHVYEKK
ncbi:MAG: GNAT family N-acetyltransferase [Candidatus Heimdallarchaeota archaeon]|nr:GNAT family N-acetyltransferase [Candidatus Heimdallarchaeota archaeon]MDH5645905.1 GNAT family N-acetyltransferase [Candidatus Heimdallarchaeota archaeon]